MRSDLGNGRLGGMVDMCREREVWLRRYLRLRNGIPGHDAISPLALELL